MTWSEELVKKLSIMLEKITSSIHFKRNKIVLKVNYIENVSGLLNFIGSLIGILMIMGKLLYILLLHLRSYLRIIIQEEWQMIFMIEYQFY